MSTIRTFGPFRLDVEAAILFRGTEPIALGRRAVALLGVLVERPGALISKDALIEAAWSGLAVEDSNLTVQIAALRRVLGEAGGASWIETMPRRGYRFVGPAVRSGDTKDPIASAGPYPAEHFATVAKPEQSESMNGEKDLRILSPSNDARSQLMVGRVAPLEMLDRMTQRMLAGQRQVAFVTGEAGIGKSAFIEMAVERLSHQGVDLLCGRCTERFGTDEAFLPLIDALATRGRTTGGAELLAAIRAHAPTWMLQMPGFMDANERAVFQREVFGATRERTSWSLIWS